MSDEPRNGHDPEQLLEDRVELALRERITVLEEWGDGVDEALRLIGMAVLAMIVAGAATALILRKRAL